MSRIDLILNPQSRKWRRWKAEVISFSSTPLSSLGVNYKVATTPLSPLGVEYTEEFYFFGQGQIKMMARIDLILNT